MLFGRPITRETGARESLREDFARDLELQRFLRIDRCEYRFGWQAKGVQVFAETGREEVIRSGGRAFAQPIDSNAG